MRAFFVGLLCLGLLPSLRADVVARTVEYKQENTVFEGSLVYDNASSAKKPGVLLVHELGGNAAAARAKAAQIVKMGYVCFTVDLFGKGINPKDGKEAATKLNLTGKDRKLIRERMATAFAAFSKQPQVEGKLFSAVGYGVGGTAVLELARTGAELEGVVCVHGDLTTPNSEDGKKIGASVLVIVGADDPQIPLTQIQAFEEEMRKGDVDWQLLRFGGVVHDFTNPQAGKNLKSGSAYDPDADKRSQEAIRSFLIEMFPSKPAASSGTPAKAPDKKEQPLPKGIPDKVAKVLKYVDDNSETIEGYEGGRTFGNYERRLPQTDSQGKRIKYREWDVNPLRQGVNRGAERLVTGSDGSAYYTDDHYKTFKKIR